MPAILNDETVDEAYPALLTTARRVIRWNRGTDWMEPEDLVQEPVESRHMLQSIVAHRMKRVLIDTVRARTSARRSGPKEELIAALARQHSEGVEVELALTIDKALATLREQHPRDGLAVVLTYLEGMSSYEVAERLGISTAMARRSVRQGLSRLKELLHIDDRR